MQNETTNADAFIITKRTLEIYVVSSAIDAVEAKKLFADDKGVLIQSNETVAVAPRVVPAKEAPAPESTKGK